MPKRTLVVVHGMGQPTAESIKKDVVDTFTKAFGFYPSLTNRHIEDEVKITPVLYNDLFETLRAKLASASNLADRLAAVDGPVAATAARQINDLQTSLGSDEFFNTHWLDVLVYRFTLVSEPVRLRVAEAVAKAISEVGPDNVHVLGHSLGTSVVHDALAKAYGPENIRTPDGNTTLNLNPVTHHLGGVHMVANVSQALETFVRVESSIVRPGALGCTSVFVEYRHTLDPITKIRPFNPTDNGNWVPHNVFNELYELIQPSAVTAGNVHELTHYLLDPKVHLSMFQSLLGFRPSEDERKAGEQKHFAMTVEAKAKALEAKFADVSLANRDSVLALLETAKAFKDTVKGLGEDF